LSMCFVKDHFLLLVLNAKKSKLFHWINATRHTLAKIWCSGAVWEYGVTTSKQI